MTEPSKVTSIIEFITQNQTLGWGIAAFSVAAVAIAAIATLTGNLDKIIEFARKYWPFGNTELTEEKLLELRQELLKLMRGEVSQRLKDSLHNLVRIDLNREEQLQQVGRDTLTLVEEDQKQENHLVNFISRKLQIFNSSNTTTLIEPSSQTYNILYRDDIQGRLLLLGEPGAGKTTELLTLAEKLTQEAEESVGKPIPMIFELSQWQLGISLDEWMSNQLHKKYRISIDVTERWIQKNQLIPLLDGLDELDIQEQEQCINAIDKCLTDYPALPLVVCCRREEYEQTRQTKKLKGAVCLQPATEEQIYSYLKSLNRERLWNQIKAQPALLELARTPLFLTMLIVAYQQRSIQNQRELFEAYIEKRVPSTDGQGASGTERNPYTQQKTISYLSWLAKQLENRNETEFLIEEIQPSWLPSDGQKVLYQLCVFLIVGLSLGLYARIDPGWELVLPATFSIAASVGIRSNYIRSREKVKWSVRRGFSIIWPFVALSILIAGLVGLLVEDLAMEGLEFLNLLIVSGLASGLVGVLMAGMYSVPIVTKRHPNQGIKSAARNSSVLCTLCGVIGGLIGGITGGLEGGITGGRTGIYSGVITLLLFGESFGGGLEVVIQHFVLRAFLIRNGSAPKNYALFLKHAVKHRLIQKTGGRYRFIHDLLRKHFSQINA